MEGGPPCFDPVVFDAQALARSGALDGLADAGRGNTFMLSLDGVALVLRHYRRGGLIRHISQRHYLFTGFERSRAFREFALLRTIEAWQLPAPRAFACCVCCVAGVLSTASLVTYKLPGETMAALLRRDAMQPDHWSAIGRCIATFHTRGVCHADLNAHNILIGSAGEVALIDFDRGTIKTSGNAQRWRFANLSRLERSVQKILRQSDTRAPDIALDDRVAAGWDALLRAYRDGLEG